MKEKKEAEKLFDQFKAMVNMNMVASTHNSIDSDFNYDVKQTAKQCSLVVCNRFIDELKCTHIGYGKIVMNAYYKKKSEYWNKVKQEVERL